MIKPLFLKDWDKSPTYKWFYTACSRNDSYINNKKLFITILQLYLCFKSYIIPYSHLVVTTCYDHLMTMSLFQEVISIILLSCSASASLPILPTKPSIWKSSNSELSSLQQSLVFLTSKDKLSNSTLEVGSLCTLI